MFQRLLILPKKQSCFIFGARGTGKSTFLKRQVKDTLYFINLLEDTPFRRYGTQPDLLIEDLKKIDPTTTVVIDEIQKLPKILDVVHHLIESSGRKFILTGSSARKLRRGSANLMAGRAFQTFLYPLTREEFGVDFDLQQVLEFGALPKVPQFEVPDKIEFLRSYAQTYLREEILEEQLVRNTFAFRSFLEIAAQENGNSLNFTKISRDLNVDNKTAQNFFQILEDTLIGFFLPAYSRSTRKSVKHQPKFYLFDLGVKRALEHTLQQPLYPGTSAYGKAFEHFVVAEIFRQNSYNKLDFVLSHYQTTAGGEIDLVLSRGREVITVEIKSSLIVDPKQAAKLKHTASALRPSRIVLLSQDKKAINLDGVECMHWNDFIKNTMSVQTLVNPVRAWRLCPPGQHWRSKHIQKTYKRADGTVVSGHPVSATCCKNPSKKDQIYSEELLEIAKRSFTSLTGGPTANDLGFKNGNSFDGLIRGWTQFWNDILSPQEPLAPNLIKALIATESGFRPDINIKDSPQNGYARGLMQVTDAAFKALGAQKGEIKDHLVHVTEKNADDPTLNIAAGVRWLFHKKDLASSRLAREASWDEAVAEYKSLLRGMIKNPKSIPQPMKDLHGYFNRLKK